MMKIPKEILEQLRSIFEIDSKDLTRLVEEIETSIPSLSLSSFSSTINKTFGESSELSAEQVYTVLKTALVLYQAKDAAEVSSEELSAELVKFLETETKILNHNNKNTFVKNLNILLNLKNIEFIANARESLLKAENLLYGCSLSLDIKPLYLENLDHIQNPVALTHQLRVHYHKHDEHKVTHFTMDSGDLKGLKRVIDEAIEKEEKLKNTLKDSGLTLIDY